MGNLIFHTRRGVDYHSGEFDPTADYQGWKPSRYSQIGYEGESDNLPFDKLVRISFFRVGDISERYMVDGFLTFPVSVRHIDTDSGPLQEPIPASLIVARVFKWAESEYEADEEDIPLGEDPDDYWSVEGSYISIPFPAGLHRRFFYEDVYRVFDVPVPKEKLQVLRKRS